MGSVAKPISNTLGDVFTLGTRRIGGSSNPFNRVGNDVGNILTLGSSGQPLVNPFNGARIFKGSENPYVSGPFSLDPNQVSADQSAINTEGQKEFTQASDLAKQQFDQSTGQIPSLVSKQLQLENSDIMENLNRGHVLDSSAYPTEIARQQAQLTQALAVPAMERFQQQQQGALAGLQGYQGGALQRGLSLEDQINNANISKTIGQVFAPQPPSGKAQFGTAAQGVGALAPWGRLAQLGKAGGGGPATI